MITRAENLSLEKSLKAHFQGLSEGEDVVHLGQEITLSHRTVIND